MYKVNNLYGNWKNYKYTVIRDCRDTNEGWWYYGSYNSIQLAQEAYREICNCMIVEITKIEQA